MHGACTEHAGEMCTDFSGQTSRKVSTWKT